MEATETLLESAAVEDSGPAFPAVGWVLPQRPPSFCEGLYPSSHLAERVSSALAPWRALTESLAWGLVVAAQAQALALAPARDFLNFLELFRNFPAFL